MQTLASGIAVDRQPEIPEFGTASLPPERPRPTGWKFDSHIQCMGACMTLELKM
jgi:hypothetical protein